MRVFLMLFFLFKTIILCANQKGDIIVSGHSLRLVDGDSVKIRIAPFGLQYDSNCKFIFSVASKNHEFSFRIPSIAVKYVYYSIELPQRAFKASLVPDNLKSVRQYLLSPGDSIFISYMDTGVYFTGRGAEKMNVYADILRYFTALLNKYPRLSNDLTDVIMNIDRREKKSLSYLRGKRRILGVEEFQLLEKNIKSGFVSELFNEFTLIRNYEFSKEEVAQSMFYIEDILSTFSNMLMSNSENLIFSKSASDAVIEKFVLDSCVFKNRRFDIKQCYDFVNSYFFGSFRQAIELSLVSLYVSNSTIASKFPQDISGVFYKIQADLNGSYFLECLSDLKNNKFMTGSNAMLFDLPDSTGKRYSLTDFKGKVILLDFWFTGCGNCAVLNRTLKEVELKLCHDTSLVFITINSDISLPQWKASLLHHIYTTQYSLNLYADSTDILRLQEYYSFYGAPYLLLIDKYSKVYNTFIDPRDDGGIDLTEQIEKALRQ